MSAKSAYDAIQAGQGTTINGKDNQIATGKTNPDKSAATRDANAADQVGGINLSISIGASSSQSKTTQTSTSSQLERKGDEMRKVLLVLSVSSALTACTFGPNGICGPQTPAAYCDEEAYERLVHPKPYIAYWEKSGITDSERRQDSTDCGGGGSDYAPSFGTQKIKVTQHVGENNDETRMRLEHDWRICMNQKGYRFTRNY